MGGYSGPKNASRTATSRFETYKRADAACKEEGSTLLVVLSFLLFLALI